jgi:hypothetical protein
MFLIDTNKFARVFVMVSADIIAIKHCSIDGKFFFHVLIDNLEGRRF